MTVSTDLEPLERHVVAELIRAAEEEIFEDTDASERWHRWERGVGTKLLDLAPNSRRAYQREVIRWTAFLGAVGTPPFDATIAHGRAYRRWLAETQDLAPASVARALAALSGIYADVIENSPGLVTGNPFAAVRRPKHERVAATPSLSLEESRQFLTAAKTVSPRAHALALLLLGTGIRIGEAIGADVGDIRPGANGDLVLTIERKGGRRAHVGLPGPVADALQTYLRSRSSKARSLVHAVRAPRYRAWPLFHGTSGRLTASEARRELERICRACGWPAARVTPHGLRHGFATIAVEACELPVRQVQHALGHANVATTEGYLHDDRFATQVNSAVVEQLLA